LGGGGGVGGFGGGGRGVGKATNIDENLVVGEMA